MLLPIVNEYIAKHLCYRSQKPQFPSLTRASENFRRNTKELLKRELEIKLCELQEKWHFTSLEKIFFEEKIYKELEKKHETWEKVLDAITKAFEPFENNSKENKQGRYC